MVEIRLLEAEEDIAMQKVTYMQLSSRIARLEIRLPSHFAI